MILSLDFGKKRVGLAIAVSGVVETREFLENDKKLFEKLGQFCKENKVEKVVIGVSEGEMARATKAFAKKLKKVLQLPIEFADETLTSIDAEGKVGWENKGRVDAVAAAMILEKYLQENRN